jgi:hypothetical protein
MRRKNASFCIVSPPLRPPARPFVRGHPRRPHRTRGDAHRGDGGKGEDKGQDKSLHGGTKSFDPPQHK